ncbi:hypothetical protein AQPE_4809 [Aquipluma nitroreducens]|uniref:Putative auto-transporter adhesin head GIN domain-containing protein n=1 Tax=Aquipluma nitroreducens TaxID=2010828 RepID=A0A5K7SGK9_9BACT|nr:head GIN domain-containing protein [Aquipluma nitroreducens]BBE20615.1 hypothetical protein AQPE_4809 [Aquipluma nitroreducens]
MKTTKIQFITALFVLLLGTSSCLDEMFIEGNGISRTETRNAEGFNQISSSGDFTVTVMPGNFYSVEITAESNLLPYISTNVDGKTLKIRTTGIHSLRQTEPIEIFITTPVLNGLTLSGSGLIETGSFMSSDFDLSVSGSGDIKTIISSDKVNANISGSGTIYMEGDALNTNFVISGSGKIKSYNLLQDQCQAVISGSGDMYVNASQFIDARISGSGRVYFVNHPIVHTSISGSGDVVDKN